MRLILLLSFLVVMNARVQEVLFGSAIFDHKSKKPIPYLDKKAPISSLEYRDTIVIIANIIFKGKRFEMVEGSYELDAVVVSETLGNSDVLNPISSYSLTSGFSSSSTPWVLALYYPNIGEQEKFQGHCLWNGGMDRF